nr:oligosaccharide flippase family protein [uncultured Caldimonas sp.]
MISKLSAFRHLFNHLGVVVASKFGPLAAVFLYSYFLDTEDYGVLSVFTSYVWIFALLMSLNIHAAVGRLIYDKSIRTDALLGTAFLAIGAIAIVCVAATLLFSAALSSLLGLTPLAVRLLLFVVIGQLAEAIFTQIAIQRERSGLLLLVTATRALGTVVLSLLLIAAYDSDKYLAILYADALSGAVITVGLIYWVWPHVKWRIEWKVLWAALSYALPLIPYMLSLTLLSQFDRVMIDREFGKAAAGLYSLSYNAGILVVMVVTAMLNAVNPRFFALMGEQRYGQIIEESRAAYTVAVLCTATIVLFGEELGQVVLPSEYRDAFDLIPVVAIGGLASVIFQIWGRVIGYSNKTYLITVAAVVATIVKIVLNIWLMPIYGYKVCAMTTIAAYLVFSIVCVAAINSKVRLFRLSIYKELVGIAVLGGVFAVFKLYPLPSTLELTVKLGLLILMIWSGRRALTVLVGKSSPARR